MCTSWRWHNGELKRASTSEMLGELLPLAVEEDATQVEHILGVTWLHRIPGPSSRMRTRLRTAPSPAPVPKRRCIKAGFGLYKEGGNVPMANVMYACMGLDARYLDRVLRVLQKPRTRAYCDEDCGANTARRSTPGPARWRLHTSAKRGSESTGVREWTLAGFFLDSG
jgi:hypothetical protein